MEYEIKFKINRKKDIVDKLKQLKAKDLGKKKEIDAFFSLGRQAVRIRKTGKEGLITLKRLVPTKQRAKVRKETQTKVEDAGQLIEIFKMLGFRQVKKIEKIRHTFKVNQGLILIDKLPFMGYFLEIEASSFEKVKRVAKIVGLDYNRGITSSYLNLFFKFIIKNTKKFKDAKTEIIPLFIKEKEFKKTKRR